MDAEIAQKQAEQKRDPLVASARGSGGWGDIFINICVYIFADISVDTGVAVIIIDDDIRLLLL